MDFSTLRHTTLKSLGTKVKAVHITSTKQNLYDFIAMGKVEKNFNFYSYSVEFILKLKAIEKKTLKKTQ